MENEDNVSERSLEQKARANNFLPLSILVSGILISGSIVYLVGAVRPSTTATVSEGQSAEQTAAPAAGGKSVTDLLARDVILGDPKAPVTLIEYGDYQCPFCVRFHEQTEPALRQNDIKNGTVRMIFRPFSFLGPESFAAAEAAECAKGQGKFWVYHDALYNAEAADEAKNPSGAENNGSYTRALFLQLASQVGLDAGTFTSCLDGHKYQAAVQHDAQDAAALGINSTPTLFINGQKVLGAVPYDSSAGAPPGLTPLKTFIDQALKKQ